MDKKGKGAERTSWCVRRSAPLLLMLCSDNSVFCLEVMRLLRYITLIIK